MFNENENATPAPLEVVGTGTGNDALAAIERAQIDTQIATARRYPRNIASVKSTMMSIATLDEETAAACFYTLPRGGKTIQGPSVRMAEIALSSYGNVKAGTRILSVETGTNPHAVVQAVVHDLERNVAYSVETRRRIVGKKSKQGKPDEDDINLAVNAGSAIAFRDAVFKVVPGALVKACFDAARKVAVGDVKSLARKREQVVGRLKQMGATEDRIFGILGVTKLEEVNLEHVETLIGLGTALKDGRISLEEAFPPTQSAPAPSFTRTASTKASDDDQIPGAEVPPVPAPKAAQEQAEQAPAPTPKPVKAADPKPAGETPQEQLARIVTSAGVTWERFAPFAIESGFAPATATGFKDVPTRKAALLVSHAPTMMAQFTTAAAPAPTPVEGGLL